MNIKTIIVDDNQDAANTFKELCLDFFPQISIVGEFSNAKEALNYIKNNSIDWLVLDIDLQSEINGFDLLYLIGNERNFEVIFYSGSCDQYLEAIRAQAFDFLNKPFSISELKNTINRYLLLNKSKELKTKNQDQKILNNKLVKIKTHQQTVIIDPLDITHLFAKGAYTEIHYIENQVIKASRNLLYFVDLLKNSNIVRVSRSLCVNLNQISHINKTHTSNTIIIFKDGTNKEVSYLISRKLNNMINNK